MTLILSATDELIHGRVLALKVAHLTPDISMFFTSRLTA